MNFSGRYFSEVANFAEMGDVYSTYWKYTLTNSLPYSNYIPFTPTRIKID
jgi:hypothetical protein